MRLPTHAPASCAPPARRYFFALIAPLTLIVSPALATHYVVDINGGGDFTTIQAALDQLPVSPRDSIVVLPGEYADSVTVPVLTVPVRLVGVGGAATTSIGTVRFLNVGTGVRQARFEGFTLRLALPDVPSSHSCYFARCVFRGAVSASSGDNYSMFVDCDFHARTTLEWCLSNWDSLRFHGAPLTITHASGTGSFRMRDCTFEGPADTLVYMPWAIVDFGAFERCRFSDAVNGLVYGSDCKNVSFPVLSCTFRDLTGAGLSFENAQPAWTTGLRPADVDLWDSRFDRCGTAVRWVAHWPPELGGGTAHMLRDSIYDSAADAVVLGPTASIGGPLDGCIVQNSGGDGLVAFARPPLTQMSFAHLSVSNSSFLGNHGDGIVVCDTFPGPPNDPTWPQPGPNILNCTFAANGGAAVRMRTHRWRIEHCTAIGNGEGFLWELPTKRSRLVSNTSVLNMGNGFDGVPADGPDSTLALQYNLAALNAGSGFRVQTGPAGSFAFNDAWGNYLSQYVGAWTSLDSNLTVDPRFCDLSAGVNGLGLQQGSPCGPSGVYGLIGARPEECPNTAAVEPPAPGAMAFAVRPSVARGSADFVPPATGAEGVVELFDLAGRIVWRAPLGPATGVMRWRGEGESGRVRAGLYWARFTRGSERATQRLVWLE